MKRLEARVQLARGESDVCCDTLNSIALILGESGISRIAHQALHSIRFCVRFQGLYEVMPEDISDTQSTMSQTSGQGSEQYLLDNMLVRLVEDMGIKTVSFEYTFRDGVDPCRTLQDMLPQMRRKEYLQLNRVPSGEWNWY